MPHESNILFCSNCSSILIIFTMAVPNDYEHPDEIPDNCSFGRNFRNDGLAGASDMVKFDSRLLDFLTDQLLFLRRSPLDWFHCQHPVSSIQYRLFIGCLSAVYRLWSYLPA